MPPSLDLPFDPIERAANTWRSRWGSDARAQEMAAATSLLRAAQLLTATLDAACAPHDLTFARYECLVLLAFSRRGEMPMSKVGERLMVHPTSATSIVQRLERQGLVTRRPNPNDGRGTLATITDAGRDVMEAATADLHRLRFGVGDLTAEQRDDVTAVLRELRARAGDFRA